MTIAFTVVRLYLALALAWLQAQYAVAVEHVALATNTTRGWLSTKLMSLSTKLAVQ